MSKVAHPSSGDSRVVVTGASGFIGQLLARWLASHGHVVRAISRRQPEAGDGGPLEWAPLDVVTDFDRLHDALEGADVVYHLAGIGAPNWPPVTARNLYIVNVAGTVNVLEAARQCGVNRVVVASSAAVYGATDSAAIDEQQALEPVSTYGLAKAAQEQACEMYSRVYGLDTIALRLFNVYGANEDMSEGNGKLIPTLVRRMMAGQEIQVFGDGQQARDFVHVRDVVGAFRHAGGVPASGHQVFNIGTGTGVTVSEVIARISAQLGVTPRMAYQPAREGETRQAVANTDRAIAHGFHMPTSFADGVSEYGAQDPQTGGIHSNPQNPMKNE